MTGFPVPPCPAQPPGPTPPARLTVAVAAHADERFEQTCRCVRSALEGARPADEVVVVVDRNPPLEARLRAALPTAVAVQASDGDGAAAARTTALHRSSGDVLVFVDDDAWVEPDFLTVVADAFADPSVVAAGGRIVPEWEDPARALPEELYWVVGSTYLGHRTDPGPITRPIGAAMAVRRAALATVGGFHPDFGPTGGRKTSSNEELATFTLVARRFGADAIVYLPDAVAHHVAPAARCRFRYLLERSLVEGTSKADARRAFGSAVMRHDRGYTTTVLLPCLAGHALAALRGDRARARAAAFDATSLAAAAAGYLGRLALTRPAARRRPAANVEQGVTAVRAGGGSGR